MKSLIKNYPFVDGNKRTAITSSALFLSLNGYILETDQKELERFALQMAKEKISLDESAKWFKHVARKRKK